MRADDDWMAPSVNLNYSLQLARQLGCKDNTDVSCLQQLSAQAIYPPSRKLRFAPALHEDDLFPLGLIRQGKWNQVGSAYTCMELEYQVACMRAAPVAIGVEQVSG